jgi:hypothetical protein
MLRVPKVILSAAPPGRLRTDAEKAYAAFQDPAFSAFVVVTLPEELPTNETLELVGVLSNELGLPVSEILVNAALTPLFSSDEGARLALLAKSAGTEDVERALSVAARRARAERVQAACIERLMATGRPLRKITRLVEGVNTHEAALELSRQL